MNMKCMFPAIVLTVLVAGSVPARADQFAAPGASSGTAGADLTIIPGTDRKPRIEVKATGTDPAAEGVDQKYPFRDAELEGTVKRAAAQLKAPLARKYGENYTVFGIGRSGFVVPPGSVPGLSEILWQTGAVNFHEDEICFVLPDILIHAAKDNLRLTQTVIRGLSARVAGQQFNLVDLPDFDVELHLLAVDQDMAIVAVGFIMKGNQAGPRLHGSSFSGSGVLIHGTSLYLGSTGDFDYLLKGYPELSPGRKSVLREIVAGILGIELVTKAKANEVIDAFAKVSKDIIAMNYLSSHCLNRALLDGLQRPVRILDENYQLTLNGVSILKAAAQDLEVRREAGRRP
jgi:hypothetical protein